MKGAPPLRFLGLVVGGWVCLRAAVLVPDWSEDVGDLPPFRAEKNAAPVFIAERSETEAAEPCRSCRVRRRHLVAPRGDRLEVARALTRSSTSLATNAVGLADYDGVESASATAVLPPLVPTAPAPPVPAAGASSRWSASAWAYWRRGESRQLAAGGLLGGSQIGGRVGYRINDDAARPLSISARVYAPVDRPAGSEATLGVEWKPLAGSPVRILAERRQAIGSEGRSAFALMAYGGVSEVKLAGDLRLEAYAQAGVVGARSRDLFADGLVAAELPIDPRGRLRIGATAWGAAQPGVSRIDAGPRLSLRIPVEGGGVRLSADWRLRIAGNASPASGPSLTIATEF